MENKLNSYIADMRETSANLAKTTYALSKKISEEKIEESKNIFKKSIEISAKRFNQEIEDDSNTESISKHKKYELLKKYEEEAYRVSNIYNEEIKKLLIEKEHLEAQKRVALIERKKLNTHDLSGCTLYATGYPCPMCLSAIIWANIKKVYYGCTKEDADKIGFRDDFIYKFIQDGANDIEILELKQKDRDICIKLFEEYKNNNKKMY